jgi:hypothetical protein
MNNGPRLPLPEFGSAWPLFYPTREPGDAPPPFTAGQFYGNGRQALLALYAAKLLPPTRLWLPDYFCSEVAESWANCGAEIHSYSFGPWCDRLNPVEIPAKAGDTVMLLNTLGLYGEPDVEHLRRRGVYVVEDHSHDPFSPWAQQSRADWGLVSLRKSYAVPDGGMLWSPQGHHLPPGPDLSAAHELAAGQVFAAMALKRDYLEGGFPPKPVFRELYLKGDAGVSGAQLSATTAVTQALLADFPHRAWRETRLTHWRTLAESLDGTRGVQVVRPRQAEAVPFGLVLQLPDQPARNRVRAAMQARQLYTAILWSLEPGGRLNPGAESLDFSRRSLVVACDGRYREADLAAMTELIRTALVE